MRLTASGLLIPTRMNERPKYRCNFPGCDWKGYDGEEQSRVRHALSHANQEEDEIREAVKDVHEEILGEGDVERGAWLKQRYETLKGQVPDPLDPKHY